MSKLKQMIKNKCEDDKGLAKELAKLAGYDTVQGFYKFINDKDKEPGTLSQVINIVRHLFGDQEKELMSEYILTLNPNKEAARTGIEYLLFNRMHDKFDQMLHRLKESSNGISKEWFKVYEVEHLFFHKKINSHDAIKMLHAVKLKSVEMKIMKEILLMYNYYSLNNFSQITETLNLNLYEVIGTVKDSSIKEMYLIRLQTLISLNYLYRNQQEKLRDSLNFLVKTSNPEITSNHYHILGLSYLFEDYEICKENLLKAVDYNKDVKIPKDLGRSICFSSLYHNDFALYEKFSNIVDVSEYVKLYYLIITNQEDAAKDLLNSMNLNNMVDRDKAFVYFCKGIMFNNEDYFFKSIKTYNIKDDKFYKEIPLRELEKRGANKLMLEAFRV